MNMSHGHYKKVCKECDTIISQCRCRDEKTVIEVTCDKCKMAAFDIVAPNTKQQLREALAKEVYLRYQITQLNERIEALEKNNER